jgi:hypothetical protein
VDGVVEIPLRPRAVPQQQPACAYRCHGAGEDVEDDAVDGRRLIEDAENVRLVRAGEGFRVVGRPCERDRLSGRVIEHREALLLPLEPVAVLRLLIDLGQFAPELADELSFSVGRGDDRRMRPRRNEPVNRVGTQRRLADAVASAGRSPLVHDERSLEVLRRRVRLTAQDVLPVAGQVILVRLRNVANKFGRL